MIKIAVGNSYSKITGLSPKQDKELREALSYTVGKDSQYYGGFGPKKKSLLSKKGEFPTGLLLRVWTLFPGVIIQYTRIAPSADIRMGRMYKKEPYPDQLKAVNNALSEHRGIISMPTGTGKSLVIALIALRLNVKTLVVVPSLEIRQQLAMSLLEVLGANHKVTVRNIDSPDLKTMTDFDCLIIDEAHHVAARTYQKLNKTAWTGIYYRFMLTATPFRNDSEETLLFEGIAGQVIFELSYKDAVKRGYIVPVEAYYLEIPKTKGIDAVTWHQVYKELVVNNAGRNSMIRNLLFSLALDRKSTLCLVKEVAHGNNLKPISFVSGADDESRQLIEKFNTGEVKVLIGTEGIIGEGVDTRACEFVILAGLGKAKSRILQAVGRAVRKYPGKESAKVILIKDRSHRFCLKHFNEECRVIKEYYGVTPIKLEI